MRGDAKRLWSARTVLLSVAILLAGSPLGAADPTDGLTSEAAAWVETSLAELTLEQKAAQLIMVRAYGVYQNPATEMARDLVLEVRDRGVGGVVVFASEVESLPRLLNDLQRVADLPLLVAADFERGVAFRLPDGSVSMPYAMAVGASRSEDNARFMGEVTAREGRALGVHWTFAPVADVNSNPENPVINLRSFGEDPELVARMVTAFIAGSRQQGMMTTVKHFPGHGESAMDSHLERPIVTGERSRLEAVELVPFRAAIEADVDAVMTAHLSVPALDPSGAPATLSPLISHDLLRTDLGFEGLIVTDALEMEGVRPAWAGEAVVRALQAGADVVLLPVDARVAVQSVVRGVREGQLTVDRIEASVRRVLAAKARMGLHRSRLVSLEHLASEVGRPRDEARAEAVARESITLVRNEGGTWPLHAEERLRLLHLVISGGPRDRPTGSVPGEELSRREIETDTLILGHDVSPESVRRVLEAASEATHVLVSAYVRVSTSTGRGELSPSIVRLFEDLSSRGTPLILVSYGSPYVLRAVPSVPVYVCAFGAAASSQRAAIAGLFGEIDVGGKLPVTLSDRYPYGHGIEIPRRAMTLRLSSPEAVGVRAAGLAEVDRLMEAFVEAGAFPGATLAVGYRGALVHLGAYGRQTFAPEAPPVEAATIFDLASLTKVVATTTMAMILVDEGMLDLDKPVQDFLPLFRGSGKENVTVRQLLTHSAGLAKGGPLYEELVGRDAYLERIETMALEYEPGSATVYSDFGPILLAEILERVAGRPIDEFVGDRVFQPLGMADTLFNPDRSLLPRIAPTELDPWRGRVVHGEVHDENAWAMGGVAGHAGLFGTAPDLARYAQMILNGGVFEHHRIVSRDTVESFTRKAGLPDSTRALGWDTKSPEGSSAGELFSAESFGHLGYTGTSMWIDPERELFVILLTNRVHPTRENLAIRQVRPIVADAVVRALIEP